ncbi:hypothetical protein [Aquimarina sp. RZ0]|uniref:hypothetical protein n=1 Tax=Aquimarina sp. RZ0 TaxID=2607730 RepID=UPI0011F306B9|nr:hypothetical protein [Aquimarina sp. RZ0]KAA1243052.1 hypothetical protein F0000_22840 [Aquimarina sp. RZ0]
MYMTTGLHMNKFIKISFILLLFLATNPISAQSFIKDLIALQNYNGNDYVPLKGYFENGDHGSGNIGLNKDMIKP